MMGQNEYYCEYSDIYYQENGQWRMDRQVNEQLGIVMVK